MIPKFRAWDKVINQIFVPDSIHFDLEGDIEGLGSKGTVFGIEDFELMQSTGLHDKNGVEIFEGDIVKATHYMTGISGVVYWSYGSFYVNGFQFKELNNLEITGNIHEHGDLLE